MENLYIHNMEVGVFYDKRVRSKWRKRMRDIAKDQLWFEEAFLGEGLFESSEKKMTQSQS